MKNNISFEEYRDYLVSISFKAKLYRKYYYFPKLNKYLKGKILEVGCGIGGFLEFNNNVEGVDINPELIKICKSKKLNASLMKIDELPFEDNIYKSVNVLSGGEKRRMLFGKMMLEHPNVIIMDEPTNHLDMESIESLNSALGMYDGTIIFFCKKT